MNDIPTTLSTPADEEKSSFAVYGLTLMAVVVAGVARWLLNPVLGFSVPYPTFFVAVIFCAWIGNLRTTLLATVLGFIVAWYFFVNPRFSFQLTTYADVVGMLMYFFVCFSIAGFSEAKRVAQKRSREAEHSVWQQKELLRITLASIGDAVIATDIGGTVTYMNSLASKLTGWTDEEARGKSLASIFHIINEQSRLPIENAVEKVLTRKTTVSLANHTILIGKDGTERPIEDSASPIRDEAGAISGAVLIFRDITQRRERDRVLENQVREFRTLAESIPQMAWMASPDGSVIWYNHRWYDYTGTTFEHVEGWGWQSLHDPQVLPEVVERWKDSITTGEPFDMVFPLKGRDGQYRSFLTLIMPVKDDEGRVVRWFGTSTDITESERTEAELRETRSRLESTLAAGEIGTWEFDLLRNLVWADRNLARFFNVTPEEAKGGPLAAYLRAVHPDDRDRVALTIMRARKESGTFESDYRLLGENGAIRWVVARGRIERDAEGQAVRMPGVVVDITAQREAEERERQILAEAAEANAKFRAFFDQGSLFAGVVEVDGTIIDPNRVCWEACGFTRDQVIGKLFWEGPWWSPSPALVSQIKLAFEEAVAGQTFRGETSYFVADGSERTVDLTILPIRDDTGRIIYIVPSGLDITQRREMENQLRASEERRRLALDSAELGAWNIDPKSNTLETDERFQIIFSGERGPVNYERAFALIVPEDRDRVRNAVAAATRLDNPLPYAEEFRVLHPATQEIRWVLGKGRANFEGEGQERRLVSFDGTVADITERKQLENDLRQLASSLSELNRRKDEFLATLAHELRNPLAPIRNGLEILKLIGNTDPLVEETQSTMERQLGQMVRLVDDLMDVSRINNGKLELRKERLPLTTILHSAIETSRPLIEEMGHELIVLLPPEAILVEADHTRLSQVILNLLNNAAKYSERGGRIRLTAERQGGDVVISVQDSGIGIAADQLPKIFQMFTQVDRSLEKSQGGLGIGLTLVKRLTEMHGGSVDVKSEGHGKGCEFTVRLPIVVDSSKSPKKAQEEKMPKSSHSILIVDDNRDGADSLAMMLRIMGNETRTAYDGEQGVAVTDEFRPQVVLFDIGLPKLNGYEACRRIREQPWGKKMVLIAVTGWGQDEDRRRSQEAGFDYHLVKPVEINALTKLLSELKPL